MAREKSIENSIKAWLRTLPGCEFRKHHASQYTGAGHPDIYGCIQGRMFLIEVKQPGSTSRPDQRNDQRKWATAGALVGEVTSLAEAQALVAPLLVYTDAIGAKTDSEGHVT